MHYAAARPLVTRLMVLAAVSHDIGDDTGAPNPFFIDREFELVEFAELVSHGPKLLLSQQFRNLHRTGNVFVCK